MQNRLVSFFLFFFVVLLNNQLNAETLVPLQIKSAEQIHTFHVEIAREQSDRANGLMFRQSLGFDQGMLFDFGAEQHVTMWMRNTSISLDMLFADEEGLIHTIATRTEPFSDKVIPGRKPTRYVLEIKGGRTNLAGIKPGDKLIIPAK